MVTFHTDGRPAEMFRHVGRAWFKGLGDVPIWEIASDTGGPAALFQAMRATWLDGPRCYPRCGFLTLSSQMRS